MPEIHESGRLCARLLKPNFSVWYGSLDELGPPGWRGLRRHFAQQVLPLTEDSLGAEAFVDLDGARGEPLPFRVVGHQSTHRRGKSDHVPVGHQEPIDAMPDDLAWSAGAVEADGRQTAGHRFAEREREPLSSRRHDE